MSDPGERPKEEWEEADSPTTSEIQRAQEKIEEWEQSKEDMPVLPSPVTVGDIQREVAKKSTRKRNPSRKTRASTPSETKFFPGPVGAVFIGDEKPVMSQIYTPSPSESDHEEQPLKLELPAEPQPRMSTPELEALTVPRILQGTDLSKYLRRASDDTPKEVKKPRLKEEQLVGPDGIRDTLQEAERNDCIIMGALPPHHGMPSPIPPDAPITDVRAPLPKRRVRKSPPS